MEYNRKDAKQTQEYYDKRWRKESLKRNHLDIGWDYEKQRLQLALITYLKDLIPNKLLEVGLGKGDLALKVSKQMKNKKNTYIGIDLTTEGIKIAEERIENKNFQFLIADGIYLPFKSNEFDLVICSEVIEHIIKKEKALSEINRVLKGGGYLLLTTPTPESLTYISLRMLNKFKKFKYGSNQPINELIERKKLAEMLKGQGFEILTHTGLIFKPYSINVLEGVFQKPLMMARWISEYIEKKNFLSNLGLYQVVCAKKS